MSLYGISHAPHHQVQEWKYRITCTLAVYIKKCQKAKKNYVEIQHMNSRDPVHSTVSPAVHVPIFHNGSKMLCIFKAHKVLKEPWC